MKNKIEQCSHNCASTDLPCVKSPVFQISRLRVNTLRRNLVTVQENKLVEVRKCHIDKHYERENDLTKSADFNSVR